MDRTLFLVAFPKAEGEILHWWQVSEKQVVSRGCDVDPLFAAGLATGSDTPEQPYIVALVPTPFIVQRRHNLENGLTEHQASSVAIAEARAQSLVPDRLHWAAMCDLGTNDVITTSIGIEDLQNGLQQLQLLNIDPDLVIPAACLFKPLDDQILQADLGFESLLGSADWATWDQSGLRDHLVGDRSVDELTTTEVDAGLVNAASHAGMNFRSGIFAKKHRLSITAGQKKTLAWLVAALVLVSVAIPTIQLTQYHRAADNADEKALAAANNILSNAPDLETAEQQLDAKLVAESLGNGKFSVLASALFSALQQTPGVSVSRLSYNTNGILSAELTAIQNEQINPALLSLQASGFVITATPRQDATGTAKADLTVRVP